MISPTGVPQAVVLAGGIKVRMVDIWSGVILIRPVGSALRQQQVLCNICVPKPVTRWCPP